MTPSVSDLSSRAIQVWARLRYSGFWLTTRMELSRLIGWNLMTFWLRPPSPESMIFSISEITGSGEELCTGKMPTDCPLHPVGIEAQDGVDGGGAVGTAAGDDQGVASVVRPQRGGLDAERVQ